MCRRAENRSIWFTNQNPRLFLADMTSDSAAVQPNWPEHWQQAKYSNMGPQIHFDPYHVHPKGKCTAVRDRVLSPEEVNLQMIGVTAVVEVLEHVAY